MTDDAMHDAHDEGYAKGYQAALDDVLSMIDPEYNVWILGKIQ